MAGVPIENAAVRKQFVIWAKIEIGYSEIKDISHDAFYNIAGAVFVTQKNLSLLWKMAGPIEGKVPPQSLKFSLEISLHSVNIFFDRAGEGRLAASVVDPANGFVYFANDNTYPGGIYQLSLNGTNPPIEINYLQFQTGTSGTNPPNGVTAANTTTNSDGILPFGEVFFRSAVFDPTRGFAYFGQDSRPNQIVKVKVAQIDPVILDNVRIPTNGVLQFSFTNIAGASFSVLSASDLRTPLTNWVSLGNVTEVSPGQFNFSDPQTASSPQRFYRVQTP